MCEAHIIAESSIICPTGQTSFKKRQNSAEFCRFLLEQVKGIEPSSQAWEARILPMNYTCEIFTMPALYRMQSKKSSVFTDRILLHERQ